LPYLSGLLSLSRHTPEIPFKSACGGGNNPKLQLS
jgi:hypothetical protein